MPADVTDDDLPGAVLHGSRSEKGGVSRRRWVQGQRVGASKGGRGEAADDCGSSVQAGWDRAMPLLWPDVPESLSAAAASERPGRTRRATWRSEVGKESEVGGGGGRHLGEGDDG